MLSTYLTIQKIGYKYIRISKLFTHWFKYLQQTSTINMHILSSLHNDYFLVIQRNQLYLIKCQNELSIECIYWHSVYLLILILLNTIQKSSGIASLGASALSMLHMVSVTKVCNNHPFLYLGTNCLWGRAL